VKEVLIIRSVSFQQLDQNLSKIKEHFPNGELSILTHEHGVKLAEKYNDIAYVYSYPVKGSFSYRRRAKALQGKRFDDIVIPVANLSGLGFFNVLLFSLTLSARRRWICNLVGELREISPARIVGMGVQNALFRGVSLALTGLMAVGLFVVIPFLLWRIGGVRKEQRHV
jgi:hypothetical protein